MKTVKKLLALLLAMAMLFALCACSDDSDNNKDKKKENKTEASASVSDPTNAPTTQTTNGAQDEQPAQPTQPIGGGNNTPADILDDGTLQGNWKANLNVDAMMDMLGAEELAAYQALGVQMGTCTINMAFENGQASIQFSNMADWYIGVVSNYIDWLSDENNFLTYMANIMSTEEEPLTPEDIRAQLEAEGSSVEDAIAAMQDEMDLNELRDMMAATLQDDVKEYTIDGNTLSYKDGATWTVDYENGNIYVLSIESDGETSTFDKGDFVLTKN